MKGKIICLMALILVFLVGCQQYENAETEEVEVETQEDVEVITFVMTGVNYKFIMDEVDNPDINVKLGDKIRIEFTSTQGYHDFVVDEFDAATKKVSDGGSTFVEFVVDEVGTFEYYCSVGNHRAQGMKGNLIVE